MSRGTAIRLGLFVCLVAVGIFVWFIGPKLLGSEETLPEILQEKEILPPGNHVQDPSTIELTEALASDIQQGYLILVNKESGLAKEYKPSDLADIRYFAGDRDPAGRYLRAAAADAFHALVEEAAAEGVELLLTTGYRSYGFQEVLYNQYVAKDGEAAAQRYSAKPGFSEHQTGLAADVSAPSVGYQLVTALGETAEGKWLSENAHHFGFIIRYPLGKEETTGYNYEPWHIRFVGREAAAYIYEEGITLEEYLARL